MSYIEQKSGETSEFLSSKEKPLPKLFQYKLEDPGEREQWNNIVDQFAKNDASSTFGNQTKTDVPQINLNQLPKNNFNQANQNQGVNPGWRCDSVESIYSYRSTEEYDTRSPEYFC